jgi:hypothetical protein
MNWPTNSGARRTQGPANNTGQKPTPIKQRAIDVDQLVDGCDLSDLIFSIRRAGRKVNRPRSIKGAKAVAKLKPCPDCGHEVSNKAYTCPSCGRTLKKSPTHPLAQGCAGVIIMAIGLFILFAMFGLGKN